MRNSFPLRLSFILMICAILFLIGGCGPSEKGKLPVTTSSKEALDHFLEGRELFDKLQATDALAYFEKAVAADSNFAMAYLFRSFTTGTAKGFFDNLKKAVSLSDQVSEGERLWILSTFAASNGETMHQKEYLKKLVEAYPNDERANTQLGNFYFGLQNYEKAIAQYEIATSINPDYSQPYNQLGYAYRFLENYNDAEKTFKKYTKLIPDNPNPYDSYAELLMKTGQFEKSIESYQKALEVNPDFFNSYIGIASDLNYLGKYEEARIQLQELYKIARTDGEKRASFFATAVSYLFEGYPGKALDELKKQYAVAEANNDAAGMAGDVGVMANILFELGKYDKSLKQYTKALNIILNSNLSDKVKENNRRNFLYNSARIAVMKKDMETAKEKAAQHKAEVEAIQNPFQIWLSHQLAGTIACAEKNYETAIEELQQANQQNPYTFYRMAMAYEKNGETAKAKELYKKAANFNALNSLNQAFIKEKAEKKLALL